jgi:hypothetical protein
MVFVEPLVDGVCDPLVPLFIPEDMFEPVPDVLLPLLIAELAAAPLFWLFLCFLVVWVVLVVEPGVVAEGWPAFPVVPGEGV